MLSFLEIDYSHTVEEVLNKIENLDIELNLDQFIEFEFFITNLIKIKKSLDFFEEIKKIENFQFKISFDSKILEDKITFFNIFNFTVNKKFKEAEKLLAILEQRQADSSTINKVNFFLAYNFQNDNNYYRAFIYYEQIISNLAHKERNRIEENLLLGCFINSSNLYIKSNNPKKALEVIAKAKKIKSYHNSSIFYLILINEISAKIKTNEYNYQDALDNTFLIEKKILKPKFINDIGFKTVRQYLKVQQLECCIHLKNVELAKTILDFLEKEEIIDENTIIHRLNIYEIEYYYLIGDNEKSFSLINEYAESLKYELAFDYEFANKIFNRTISYYKEIRDYEQLSMFLGIFHELNNKEVVQQKQIKMQLADAEFLLENKVREIEILNKLKAAEEKQVFLLKEKNKELERFAYVLAHDIKNPIREIGILVEIIFEENKLSNKAKLEMIELVKKSSNDVNQLVNSILEYTTLENNKEHFIKVNFNEIVEKCIKKLEDNIKLSNAVIDFKHIKKDEVCMDEISLSKIIIHLLDNGIKFSKKNSIPKISISGKSTKEYFEFSIKDEGIGIENDTYQEIFTSFKKNNKNKFFNGLGLGLATCQEILNLYNGEIIVKSIEGIGTEFKVKIPIYK